jgi:hypothetical protein
VGQTSEVYLDVGVYLGVYLDRKRRIREESEKIRDGQKKTRPRARPSFG